MKFPAFDIFNITKRGLFIEAAGGGSDSGAGGGGIVTPPATSSGSGNDGGNAASSAAPGSAAGSPPAGGTGAGDDGNIAQLRGSYDTLKKAWEPAAALGRPEEVLGHAQTAVKLYTETQKLGKELGYSPASIQKAFKEDPVNTLAWLRNEIRTKGGQGNQGGDGKNANADVQKLVDDAVKKATAPYTEKVNKQEAEAAMKLVDTEFTRLHTAAFPTDGTNPMPEPMQNLFFDAMQMLMDTDPNCYTRIREGKTSDISKYYDEAKSILTKAHVSWNEWEQKKLGLGKDNGAGGGNKAGAADDKPSLQDIIEGNDKAVRSLKSMQR